MSTSEELSALVAQMPGPDGKGMYTENIDNEKIDKAIEAVYQRGRKGILGLIDMLSEPGSDADVKPHYALHCVINRALIIKDEQAREEFSKAMASRLAGDRSNYVKSFLCQELQWAGGKEATPELGKLLLEEALVESATAALVAIRGGAAEQFRKALPRAQGKCRLNIVQGLGAVEDRRSAEALREALADADPEVRLAAGWGLARMGDPGSVDLLIKAADAPPGWQRIQATKHCLLLAENLQAGGKKDLAENIYAYLRETRTDPSEQYVRKAAGASG